MARIHGNTSPRFENIAAILSANIDSGADVGASVAVAYEGELVVDIWGGHTDEARTCEWQENTLTNVFSSTKTMTFLCALMLVDRGELELSAPVARYWPEFAAAGKAEVQVRHLFAHSAGLAGWQEPMQVEDFYDWDKCTQLLAAQAPWWTPGSKPGYHAFTQGYLLGELVRRISGQSFGSFFASEVASPMDADFHIGLDVSHDERVALVIPPTAALPVSDDHDSASYRTFMNPPLNPLFPHDPRWRRAEIPAANGHGNARSVVRAQAALGNGGEFNGARLLSPATIRLIFEEQIRGKDIILGIPVRYGLGYGLPNESLPYLPDGRIGFWGGWGGSLVIVDADAGLTFAYMMNKMGNNPVGDARGAALISAMYEAIAG